jgi:15-hydroxyprostaglandin dehydrogenase (NAD)
VDFVALNAGIDDRDDIFASISGDSARPPRRPNMLTFAVNLYGPYYGLKLAAHYMSLVDDNARGQPSAQQQSRAAGGKIVITSSVAGFRAHELNPQYSSSKYGLLGLTRAVAPGAARVGIRVNCVCPAVVATGLAPPGMMEAFPESMVTPMATMMRAFDDLGRFDSLASDGKEKWVSSGPNGAVVEANLQDLIYREEPEMKSDSSTDPKIAEAWRMAYEDRNKRFAAMSQDV